MRLFSAVRWGLLLSRAVVLHCIDCRFGIPRAHTSAIADIHLLRIVLDQRIAESRHEMKSQWKQRRSVVNAVNYWALSFNYRLVYCLTPLRKAFRKPVFNWTQCLDCSEQQWTAVNSSAPKGIAIAISDVTALHGLLSGWDKLWKEPLVQTNSCQLSLLDRFSGLSLPSPPSLLLYRGRRWEEMNQIQKSCIECLKRFMWTKHCFIYCISQGWPEGRPSSAHRSLIADGCRPTLQ